MTFFVCDSCRTTAPGQLYLRGLWQAPRGWYVRRDGRVACSQVCVAVIEGEE